MQELSSQYTIIPVPKIYYLYNLTNQYKNRLNSLVLLSLFLFHLDLFCRILPFVVIRFFIFPRKTIMYFPRSKNPVSLLLTLVHASLFVNKSQDIGLTQCNSIGNTCDTSEVSPNISTRSARKIIMQSCKGIYFSYHNHAC